MASDFKLIPLQDSFPSSGGFDLISSALSDDAERKDAVKKGGAIFAFTLKNSDGETADWHIDLKESGKVGSGAAPEGKKANGKTPTSTGVGILGYKIVLRGWKVKKFD